MKKVVYFAIAIAVVSLLSSCALYSDQCPGVAVVDSAALPA